MSIVLNGCIALNCSGIDKMVSFLLFILTFIIGLTRVYSCSRFIYQIVGSFITGSIGLLVSQACMVRWKEVDISWKIHVLWMIIVLIVFSIVVMIAIEDNSSSFGGIPNSEYVRVIKGEPRATPVSEASRKRKRSEPQRNTLLGFTLLSSMYLYSHSHSHSHSHFRLARRRNRRNRPHKNPRAHRDAELQGS